jgi:hypothetical protein
MQSNVSKAHLIEIIYSVWDRQGKQLFHERYNNEVFITLSH